MKKFIFGLALMLLTLFACSENKVENDSLNSLDEESVSYDSLPCIAELRGNYIGKFNESSLRIQITYVNDHKVIGYNILRGLQRNLSGNVVNENGRIQLILNEPGDHEHDGKFILNLDPNSCKISGEWHSNSGEIPVRKFELEKVNHSQNYEPPFGLDNFANVFRFLHSGYGDLDFQEDGRALFTIFESRDDISHDDKKVIYGNWAFEDKKFYVEWQKNNIFKQKKTYYTIENDEDEYFFLKYDTIAFHHELY